MPIGVSIPSMSETYVKELQTVAEPSQVKNAGSYFCSVVIHRIKVHPKTDFTTEGLNQLSLKSVELIYTRRNLHRSELQSSHDRDGESEYSEFCQRSCKSCSSYRRLPPVC